MLKLSTLLSKLDFSTMGDLRADLVGEAERLEAIEEVRDAISRECGKADAAPVVAVDGVQLDCEIEWAVYGTGKNMWLCPPRLAGDHSWQFESYNAKRWEARNGAQSYINIHKIDAAIPFPVPKIKEAE